MAETEAEKEIQEQIITIKFRLRVTVKDQAISIKAKKQLTEPKKRARDDGEEVKDRPIEVV